MMSEKRYSAINDETCGWIHTAPEAPSYPSLEVPAQADWVIVGAGFTGLAAAYRIAELHPDDSIIMLDAEQAGKGASSRNSGYIVDITLNDGGSTLADAKAQLVKSRLNQCGLDLLRERVKQYGINCDWDESGKFHCAADARNVPKLEAFETFLKNADIPYNVWQKKPLSERLGTAYYQYAVQTLGGVLVNPAALINGLLENLPTSVSPYDYSPVLGIKKDNTSTRLITDKGSVNADRVIIAVNALMPRLGIKQNRVFPLTLTASLTRTLNRQEYDSIGQPDPWGVLSASSMGATVRLTNDHRILIRNTVEWNPKLSFPSHELESRIRHNRLGLKKRFPGFSDLGFEYSWSGNVCISRNSKPVFEKNDDNLYLAGCYNAGGVAMGSLFGKLIVDYASGHESDELSQVLAQEKPVRIPPRPLLDIGLKTRLAYNRFQGRREA